MNPLKYHRALVALHWLLALLLIAALVMGTFALKTVPNSSSDKIDALRGHMIAGGVIFVLTLLRVIVRLKTAHPEPASTGNALLDRLAPAIHWALYALVLLMAGSGIAMSVLAGLPAIVFNGVGSLPVNFDALPPRAAHGILANLLMIAIALHVAAALFHQFVRQDGLLSRMSFGRK